MDDKTVELDLIFGPKSSGSSLSERAATSIRKYVRSQVQIAEDSSEATGHKLNAPEALDAYGVSVLKEVAVNGSAPLVTVRDEPAATLKNRREALNLTVEQVAAASNLKPAEVILAETVGKISPIRTLERLAQVLALDDRQIGCIRGAGADEQLGVRLRDLEHQRGTRQFSPADVLSLSEAAWVIAKQTSLYRFRSQSRSGAKLRMARRQLHKFVPDADYGYPTYEQGYRLAERTRTMLGIGENAPVPSLRSLIEEQLEVPVVQLSLNKTFAGATIANGQERGIAINERGMNTNVWVRRMTLAHELCHLLWDPDEKLDRLKVDEYGDIDPAKDKIDPVEMRANSFAVDFLAPREAVRNIHSSSGDVKKTIAEVMQKYGISLTAARHHVRNATGAEPEDLSKMPPPSKDWLAAENLTVDYFPLKATPVSRRGRFAGVVLAAMNDGLISEDTAAGYLKSSLGDLQSSKQVLAEIFKSSRTETRMR